MKLYNVTNGSQIRLKEDAKVPVGGAAAGKSTVLKFHHIDGAYSYCTDEEGAVFHPAAWTGVEIVFRGDVGEGQGNSVPSYSPDRPLR